VLLQNRGRGFRLDPDHPSALAPRKRPFHTLMASIVTRDAEPVVAFSTMGGQGQAMFHVQVLTNLLDYGMDPQEAIERPRFVIGTFAGEAEDTVHVERRVPADVLDALRALGHAVSAAPALFVRTGHAHAITFRDGTLLGGADPRGDGVALGF
jgi:gamma-glutamyltranspeptidase/glutathione hydrolase